MKINNPLRILFVEDVPTDKEIAERELKKNQLTFVSTIVDTENRFCEELENFKPDIVISDYSMPKFDGMTALKITKEKDLYLPFLLFTGSNNEDTAVNCMKTGADDYILKDNLQRLAPAIESAIDKCTALRLKEKAENELREKMNELEKFNALMVGRELKMVELKKEINELLVSIGKEVKYDTNFETTY